MQAVWGLEPRVSVTLARVRRLMLIAVACSLGATAHAHIGPSEQENNRYVKLTLLGNRVRLLYTYYIGEVPGRQVRHRMDANRDGVLDDQEQQRFGAEIAVTVAANLDVTVDERRVSLQFDTVSVGVGTPTVAAGAFSVDLVTWLCLDDATARTHHDIVLFDHWRPPQPGETELRVEESPGVEVSRSTFGSDGKISQLEFKWIESQDPRPLDVQGLFLAFDVVPGAADMATDQCGAPPPAPVQASRAWRWVLYAVGAGALLVLIVLAIGRRTGS